MIDVRIRKVPDNNGNDKLTVKTSRYSKNAVVFFS
jgi:hypothetical protein